jgi:hypothetical protein
MIPFLFHTEYNLNKSDNHFFIIPLFMKKILNKSLIGIVLISFALLSCDKIPDGIVEPQSVDYKIFGISAPNAVVYLPSDSTVITSVSISNFLTVDRVWCKVSSLNGSFIVKNQVPMMDDGNSSMNGDQLKSDGIYSGKFVMSRLNPNGKYQIEFFVEDKIHRAPDNLVKVGTHIFTFDNLQINFAPVISNLIIPSSVNRGESFVFSIKVLDQNGPADITQVYFKLFRPDGSKVLNGNTDFFLMVDNGNLDVYGDQIAGDGIYSFKNSLSTAASTQIGVWKFEFLAIDHGGKTSNILIQNLIVN